MMSSGTWFVPIRLMNAIVRPSGDHRGEFEISPWRLSATTCSSVPSAFAMTTEPERMNTIRDPSGNQSPSTALSITLRGSPPTVETL